MHVQTLARLIACSALVAAAISVPAATLTVTLRTDGGLAGADAKFAVLVRSADRFVDLEIQPHVPREVELPKGTYAVTLAGETRFWAAPQTVYVGANGAAVVLDVYRAVSVRGRFRPVREADEPPAAITARAVLASASSAEIACQAHRWEWRCRVPGQTRHLSVKPAGYIANYWWDLSLDGDRDLGERELRTGASFVGYVSLPRDRQEDIEKITVRLSRSSAAMMPSGAKTEAAALVTHPKKNGFFHFDGIAEGEYIVRAALTGLTSQAQTIRILRNLESELREPLLLEPPHSLTVIVSPAHDGNGAPWWIDLSRESDTRHVYEPAGNLRLSRSGLANVTNLPAGRYSLTVRDAAHNGLATRSVAIPDDGPLLEIAVDPFRVTGEVRLGDEPLRATVVLGGEHGVPSVTVSSRDDGTFEAVLPRDFAVAIPEVSVIAEMPPVKSSLSDVRVVDNRVRLVLPETTLTGKVVDEKGQPARTALVNVTPADNILVQVGVREDGSFDIYGLPPGPALISAADGRRRSNSLRVSVSDHAADDGGVLLVVKKTATFRGRVVSAAGPVAGAAVYVFPAYERGFAARRIGTDVDGTFEAALPPGTTAADVFVSAPGFGLTLLRRGLASEIADVPVTQAAGELAVEFERTAEDVAANRWPTVSHGGATREIATLAAIDGRAVEQSGERSWRLRFAQLEAGEYTFCNAASCTTVSLAPFGKAAARLP